MYNTKDGNKLLHLHTNKFIKHQNLKKIPITPSIIKQVHAVASLDDMPQGKKIRNIANNVIFYSSYISGVDCDAKKLIR